MTLSKTAMPSLDDLPPSVAQILEDVLCQMTEALGEHLQSVVLFGSGAEGRLRATSDVNLFVLLSHFDPAKMEPLREPLQAAKAVVKLSVMVLLREEFAAAAEAFADKFSDIRRRRRVLFGEDPFATLQTPRQAIVYRLRQVLLNLTLRLRNAYLQGSVREEQLPLVIADAAGPIRASAATLLELEGERVGSPKEALIRMASSLDLSDSTTVLRALSEARETQRVSSGDAILLDLIELTRRLSARAQRVS